MIIPSDVQAHVEARNALNAHSIQLRQDLISLLTPYLGCKIRKLSGWKGWIAKLDPEIRDLMTRYSEQHKITFHFEFSVYSFWVETKTHYPVADNSSVRYIKQTTFLGKWDENNGELQSLLTEDEQQVSNPKTDWQADEIVKLQARISDLRQQLSDSESCFKAFL
jgi:hypothetical protein